MKQIEIDNELYNYIAANTQEIGESASDILLRLLQIPVTTSSKSDPVSNRRPSAAPLPGKPAPVQNAPVHLPWGQSNVFTDLLQDTQFRKAGSAVARFLYLLDFLYRRNPSAFARVLEVQGRSRLYFSTSAEDLLIASETANPKQIGTSPYWVTTNNNTERKRGIMILVLSYLGCEAEVAKIIAKKI